MDDLNYTNADRQGMWTSRQLLDGVAVALEPRDDLFLLIQPAGDDSAAEQGVRIASREFSRLPDHASAAARAAPIMRKMNLYRLNNAIYGKAFEAVMKKAKTVFELPKDNWLFRMDPDDRGPADGWYRSDAPKEGWDPITIGSFWGKAGGKGAGWYRREIRIPERPADQRLYLQFGGVDEELKLNRLIGNAQGLAWSPNGELLAGTFRTAPLETEPSSLFVIRADGKDPNRHGRFLVDVYPTATRLGGARRHGLMSWYSHGSARPRRVLKTSSTPQWSPNGKHIAFSSDLDSSGAFHVYTIPATGGEMNKLSATRSAWPNRVKWKPLP